MTRASDTSIRVEQKALVVHADMGVLSALQSELSKRGITPIIARDLPTALLAITQHYFDFAIVATRISEEGDGWPVAGVFRLVFPKSTVVALAPSTDVLTLKAAINNGIDELCESSRSAEQVVATTLGFQKEKSRPPISPQIQ